MGQVEALQRTENMVYRAILRAPGYVAVETLRGEIGSSCMSSRLIKGTLLLTKSMMESENVLVREVLERVRMDDKNVWNRGLRGCLDRVGLEYDSLRELSKGQLKGKVIEMDTMEWRREMNRKSSLYIYRIYKEGVKDEDIYRNDGPSVYLYRARANVMGLNDFNRHQREEARRVTLCGICGEEDEDLCHFLLRCRGISERDDRMIERMRGVDDVDTLGKLLFTGGHVKDVGTMIYRMWGERSTKMG